MSGNTQPAPTASMTVSGGQAGVFPCTTGYYPREGSRVVSAQYNWTAQAGIVDDLSQLVARGVETTIQSAWIDNSACAQVVTLLVSGSEQVITVPASSQGAYPLLFTGTPQIQLSVPAASAGSVTRVYYLNFPLAGASSIGMAGGASNGQFVASPPELVTGTSQAPLLGPYGSTIVTTEPPDPTYSAATAAFTAAAAPTDIFTISGSASKTIRVHEIAVQGLATANALIDVFLVKRSTLDTGGTSALVTGVPHDSASAAASAVVRQWTVNPAALGTAVGNVDASTLGFSPNSNNPNQVFRFGPAVGDQSIVLRGVNDLLAVNLNSIGAAGLAPVCKVKWTEV